MNKKILGTLAFLFVIALTYFFIKEQQSQTFAEANRIFPPYNKFLSVDELSIYSEEENAMVSVKISSADMKIITELMNTTEVSGDNISEPSTKTLFVEQNYRNSAGGISKFSLYRKNNTYYLAFPIYHFSYEVEWYKLKSNDLPEFYLKLLEK